MKRLSPAYLASVFAMLAIVFLAAFAGGCSFFSPTPVVASATLTQQQADAINTANGAMAAVDTANFDFQIVAAATPQLAADATIANEVANEVDTLTGQYTADVRAGNVLDAATVQAQIRVDVLQVLTLTRKTVASTTQASK